MSKKSIFSPTELKNIGIGLLVMGMISIVTSFTITGSPISYMTIGALLILLTGIGLLIAYYIKTDKKQLAPKLYLAVCVLAVVLVYYFAITHV
jgi:peptidoglycan/LPS O-acetylase OafA/YrhL